MLSWALLVCLAILAHTAHAAERVLFFSPIMGKPSQQAKYTAIARVAQQEGLAVDFRFTDEVKPDAAGTLFAQYRIVIFDALSGPDTLAPLAWDYGAAVAANPGLIAIAAGLPGTPLTQNAPAGIEDALYPYLHHGGRENFVRLARFIKVRLLGAAGDIAPPLTFPQEALYHPDAPNLVFADTESYLAWRAPKPGQASVAVIFHRNHLAADSMAPIDATVRALEKRGLAVLPYYSDIVSDYLGEKFLLKDGKPRAQVIITHQAMVIDAEKIRAQATRIGLPILHALQYRDANAEVWAQDPSGIHLTQVPMTLVMPEIIGFSDPLIVAAQDAKTKRMEVIPVQLEALVAKAANLARLTQLPNADKKLAVFFYNYPPGVSNLGAAFLDVPKSLAALTAAMKLRGYDIAPCEAEFFEQTAWTMLKPFYANAAPPTSSHSRLMKGDDSWSARKAFHANLAAEAEALVEAGYVELYPVAAYRRWYDRLPADVRRRIETHWGAPEKSRMTILRRGERHFVIPRLVLGKTIVLPQPRRGESENYRDDAALYHDTNIPVNHSYLATYQWLREKVGIDALVHLGTHGTQEWLSGKERGLSVFDDPYLSIGDTPVFYPYIADNLAEGIQAKRRGRAVTISHLTPPFAVTGTFNELSDVTRLINDYESAGVESLKMPVERMHAMRNVGRDDIVDLEIIPAAELKRPRIDVVISVTGLYRDTFPGPMKRLAEAVEKVAALNERDNFVRRNTLALQKTLSDQGVRAEEVAALSTVRVFSSQVGQYGNGVSSTATASDTWESDDKIARNYLERLGYYFGADEKHWGKKQAGLDLYAKNLAGSDAVLFSRTSNLYGLLTSDDPFGYFGALSLAVRTLSGKSPDSLIANLRDADNPAMEPTARFMAKELKGRQFHPQWIAAQRDQGYSGTLNVLDAVENFWGWQVVDPTAVRDDQWQEFHDVYLRDKLKLGTREWFEEKNPRALAQIAERMLEANRKGYWRADVATLQELVEVLEDAMRRHAFRPMNEKVLPFVEQLKGSGYGLDFVAPAPGKLAAQPPQIEGQRLEKQANAHPPADLPRWLWLVLALLAATMAAGALRQSGRLPAFRLFNHRSHAA